MGQCKSKQDMASLPTGAAAAAASSPSSSLPLSSTDYQNHYTYQVFLSFRGEDTRFNFTDHLHTALDNRGIKTFIDDELRRGEEISSALLKAIEESRVSVIVFSRNYAASRWCLDELVKILECRESKGQEVRPVFYKVAPSDVRHQTGAFGDAFATLDQCKYKDSLGKWRKALSDAANLSGWTFEEEGRSEAKFIKRIVGDLSAQVINPSRELHVAEHPIGLESCRQDVIRLLDAGENRMVGIWGPGGIGKTTIAKDVFNSIRHEFEESCFLADVRSNGLDQLQKTILLDILGDSKLKVRSADEGVSLIKTMMRNKKVLLILDDVTHSSQLQKLVPSPDCFGPGSRILITTRDKHWLIAHQVDKVYKVNLLDYPHALELFSLHAFRRNGPPSNYLKLAQRAICYAQGLPLALVVLGSHLLGRSTDEWEAILDSCKGGPQMEIQDVLRLSYDALGADLKELFLHIACFFKGKSVAHVKPILEDCYDLKTVIGFQRLQEKALIRIDKNTIWMHDLIEEMGKDIVYQESPDEPGERSRVWSEEDVENVLTNNTGTNKVIGIQVPWPSSTISLNAKSFSKMKRLRYISMSRMVEYESFSGEIDYLSDQLRWLDWPNSPLQSFPSDFRANRLVMLSIPDSHRITRLWEGRKNFSRLTCMDLRGCESLTGLPDFSGIPNLKKLNLADCKNLTTIPCNELQNLEILNVSRCSNLLTFQTKASMSHDHDSGSLALPKLRVLKTKGCNLSTVDFIGSLDCLETLTELHLSSCNFVSVPALGKFVNLKEINLSYSKRLREIPELPPNILEVNARDCESLDSFFILPKSPISLSESRMYLWNCQSLGYDMEKMENILLNNQKSRFSVVLPGSDVPKWFHCSKELAANEKGVFSKCAISFEIPSKLNWENIGVAVCSGDDTSNLLFNARADISINGVLIYQCSRMRSSTPDHMWLTCIPLSDEIKGKVDQIMESCPHNDQKGWWPYKCRVQFYPAHCMKSCGVHLVCQPPNEYSNKIVMADQISQTSDWEANIDLVPDWLSTLANYDSTSPASTP